MQQELGACRVLRRRRPRRFAVAGDWKVDPLACFCAFLAPGAVARAELSMGKDARRCSPRTLSTLVEQRAALVLRAFTAPSDVYRTSQTPRQLRAGTARRTRSPSPLHTLAASISERRTHQ